MTNDSNSATSGGNTNRMVSLLVVVGIIAFVGFAIWQFQVDRKNSEARLQVTRWAEKLDAQTTKTGVYIRHQGKNLPEKDPRGNALQVQYKQGGVAETVTVRSAGPDGTLLTSDDIVDERMAANFKGLGEGIKKNVSDIASETMKGAVKGTVEGIKGVFSKKKKNEEKPEKQE
jgi:hypothetical protein